MASQQGPSRSSTSLSRLDAARAAVSSGAPSVGIVARNGVVIATANELQSPLFDVGSECRVATISERVGMVFSGLNGDFRLLVEKVRNMEQTHFETHQQHMPVPLLARELGTFMKFFAQTTIFRPFALSLLICGWVEGQPFLYNCDPCGASVACLATASGKHAADNKTFLGQSHSAGLELKNAVYMALLALKHRFQGNFTAEKIEVGVCDEEGFRRFSVDEIKTYLNKIRNLL